MGESCGLPHVVQPQLPSHRPLAMLAGACASRGAHLSNPGLQFPSCWPCCLRLMEAAVQNSRKASDWGSLAFTGWQKLSRVAGLTQSCLKMPGTLSLQPFANEACILQNPEKCKFRRKTLSSSWKCPLMQIVSVVHLSWRSHC